MQLTTANGRTFTLSSDSVANHVTACLISINVSNAKKYANMFENFIHQTLTFIRTYNMQKYV